MTNIVYLDEIFPGNKLLKRTCDTNIDWFVLERIDQGRCRDISALERQVETGRKTQLEFDVALAELDRDMKLIHLLHEMEFDTRDINLGKRREYDWQDPKQNPYLLSREELDRIQR